MLSVSTISGCFSYPQLLPAEPSALAVGTSSMYVLLRERAHAFASMAGCGVVHLDRHARRSVSRHSLFRSDCPSSLAMYEDDEALMVDNNGEHPHVRRVGLRLRVSDVANASDRVLWRCSRPGCYLYGLATGASAATALILSGGHGGDGSGRSGDQSSNAEAVLTTVDLKSGRKFNQVRINLPFPAAGEGPGGYLQKGSRLLAPSYLMTRSFTPLPLSEKADPRRATRGLSLIGAVDIEAMRAAVLSHWDELWGGASKTHAYNFLFFLASTAWLTSSAICQMRSCSSPEKWLRSDQGSQSSTSPRNAEICCARALAPRTVPYAWYFQRGACFAPSCTRFWRRFCVAVWAWDVRQLNSQRVYGVCS